MSVRSWVVATAVAVACAACGDNLGPTVEVTPGEVSVPVGLSQDVDVMEGDVPAALDGLTWQVADASIAAVSWEEDHVVVRGRSVGRTRAVTDYYGAEVVVDVIVTEAIVQGLEVGAPSVRVPVGVNVPIVATARMSDGMRIDVSSQAVWSLESTEVAEVEGLGVRGLLAGTTVGHAGYGGYTASFGVEVVDAALSTITVSPPSPQIVAGIDVVFTASGVYSDGTVVDLTTTATWSVGNPGVATLVGHRATGVAAGSTAVTASHAGVTGTAQLVVSNAVPVDLHVTPNVVTVPAGLAETFHATATLSDGSELDVTEQVTWTSSAPLVASVQSGSTIHAWLPGTTSVTATLGALQAVARLDVSLALLVSIELTPGSISIAAGTSRPIVAVGYFSDGTSHDLTDEVTWWTGDTGTIGVAAGIIAALAPGHGVVRASLGLVVGTADVEVTNAQIVSIEVTSEHPSLTLGLTAQLRAIAHLSDGTTQDVTTQAAWTSDSLLVLAVDTWLFCGRVTALGLGTATITAQVGEVSASVTIAVSLGLKAAPTEIYGRTKQYLSQ